MNQRNHWQQHERPDLHQWVHQAADASFDERIRARARYLRWLHRAVFWERVKERVPAALMFTAWFIIPGSTIAILAYKFWRRK